MHRVDAELTAGMSISPVRAELSIDGINEVLTWIAGDPDVIAEDSSTGSSGTVLFYYGDGAWLVELGDGKHLVTPALSNARSDVRMRSDPLALDLLSWGRPSAGTWPIDTQVNRLRARIIKSAQWEGRCEDVWNTRRIPVGLPPTSRPHPVVTP